MSVQIRKFTPSLLPGSTLEQLYVERDDVLADIVARVADARSGDGIGHVLVHGPRGAGKTHLISLVHHRAREAAPTAPIAWLVEDPYGILSYTDLLRAIVARAEPKLEVSGDSVEHLEAAIEVIADAPLLVLAENFDEILDQIGDLGQQRLRRLIESTRKVHLVVTTTTISADLAEQPAPFYGFFNQVRLDRFTTDQALEYLAKRAETVGDIEFAEELADPAVESMARRRVVAIEQLAGGLPRVWALLSQGLSIEQLDELVSFFLASFDDVTPYYQSQLRTLAPLQRRIVLTMARENRALSAKALAALTETAATSVTKTLRDLMERGWVGVIDSPLLEHVDGRVTYYELNEPLLRLALDVKDNAHTEVRTLLEFVKAWFDPADIETSTHQYAMRALAELGADDPATAQRWMLGLTTTNTPSLELLSEIFDALWALHLGDGEAVFALPSTLRRAIEAEIDGPNWLGRVMERVSREAAIEALKPTSGTEAWLARHEALHRSLPVDGSLATLAMWQAGNGRFDEAELTIRQLDRLDQDAFVPQLFLGIKLFTAGREADGLELFGHVTDAATDLLGADHPVTRSTQQLVNHFRTLSTTKLRTIARGEQLGSHLNCSHEQL